MRKLYWGLIFAFGCAGPMGAWAGNVVVPAPCSDDGGSGLKSCKEFLINGSPAGVASGLPPVVGTNGLLYKRVRDTILGNPSVKPIAGAPAPSGAGWYQHVDPDPLNPPGPPFGTTICNLVPGPFNNNTPEGLGARTFPNATSGDGSSWNSLTGQVTNQLGESCGNPVWLKCHGYTDGTFPDIHGHVAVTIQKVWNSDPSRSQGTLEDGFGHGGMAAATTCYLQQVMNEIQTSHQLTVMGEGSSGMSPCSTLATAGLALNSTIQGDIQTLKSELTSNDNLADIANCDNSGSDKGRQSAQQLCAHRLNMETTFVQLAACEIFARAQYSYLKQVGSSAGQQAVMNMLVNAVQNPCSNQCQNQLNPSITNQPNDDQISNCVNQCYIQKMPPAFQNYLQNLWPGDGSGKCDPMTRNDRMPLPLGAQNQVLLVGMLAWAGKRSRKDPGGRKTWRRARIRLGIPTALAAALFAFEAMTADGCGDGGGGGGNVCVQGCQGTTQSGSGSCTQTIDETQNCASPTPSATPPGTNPIKATLWDGNAAALSGDAAHLAEGAIDSKAPPAVTTGNLPTGLHHEVAASAGGIAPGSDVAKGASGAMPGMPGAPLGGGGGGHGGAAGGGSGGMGADLGSATTTAATDGTLGPSGMGSDPNANGGLYKGSGGGAAGAGAAGAGGLTWGGGGSGGEGGNGVSEESFNADMNGTSGAVAGSEDPADYFTRIGLGENIFKVVERRYRQKTTRWVTDDLSKPNPAAPAPAPTKKI